MGVAGVELTAPNVDAVLSAVRDANDVRTVNVLRRGERTAPVQFETTTTLLLSAGLESGVPLVMPFDVVDGEASWTVTAARRRLSRLDDALADQGVEFTVDVDHRDVDRTEPLTDRQRRGREPDV